MKVKYIIAMKKGNTYIKNDTLYCARVLLFQEDTKLATYPYTKSVFKLIDATSLTRYIVTIRINTYILLTMLDELSKG